MGAVSHPVVRLTWAGGHGICATAGRHNAVASSVSGGKLHFEAAPAQTMQRQTAAVKQDGHTLSQQNSGL